MRRVFVDPDRRAEARAILKGLADDAHHSMDDATRLPSASDAQRSS